MPDAGIGPAEISGKTGSSGFRERGLSDLALFSAISLMGRIILDGVVRCAILLCVLFTLVAFGEM